MLANIYGSGGGGGGKSGKSKQPSEAPNTLHSKAEINALFLLGEGEIEGFPEWIARCVYLDDVPVQNADGSHNFNGVMLGFRPGTLTQNYISSFPGAESDVYVGQQIKKSVGSVVKTINNAEINAVRLRFMIPQLQKINSSNNKIEETSVTFLVEIRTNQGAWIPRLRETIVGKTTSPVERFYRLDLPQGNTHDIRVTRITDDSQSTTLSNDLFWSSYVEITDAKFRYPLSALLWMRLPGDQFKSMPRVSVRLKWKKVLIPNNYNPETRTYNGVWDGNFNFGWTNNPAWVLYDILINERYGAGARISANSIDKWSFYAIAQYCDELVPSQSGGAMVPRFTCNAYIRDASEAYELLNAIASSFRGSLYWAGGTIMALQDKPRSPVKIFNKSNVIEEVDESGRITSPAFKYSYTSKTARHTYAIVSYLNKDNFYRPDVEAVEHSEGLSRYGYNPIEIQAFGCTSADQARRLGHWVLETEQNLTKTVTFRVGASGAFVSPGDVIEISDSLRSIQRMGGRIKYAVNEVPGGTTIILDSSLPGIAGGDGFIIELPDGSVGRTIIGAINDSDPRGFTIQLTTVFDPLPLNNAVWVATSNTLKPALYSVFSIVDRLKDSVSCYEITATEYNASIYNRVDLGTPLINIPTSLRPPTVPNRPFNIKASVAPTLRDGQWNFTVKASWDEPLYNGVIDPYTKNYEIELRQGAIGSWGDIRHTPDPYVEYINLVEDTYYIRVRSKDILERFSPWVESIAFIVSRPLPPAPIGTVSKTIKLDGAVILTWSDTQYYPFGLSGYHIYINNELFQFVPAGTNQSLDIIRPPGVYTVEIKSVDNAKGESLTGIIVLLGDEFAPKTPVGEVTYTIKEDGSFQLFWTDSAEHYRDFKGYRVYKNDSLLEETANKFTIPFEVTSGENAEFKIYALNTQNFESLGYLEFVLGADTGSTSVPNPSGTITKKSATDGGVILEWTDNTNYTNFGGYRVYLNGELVGDTALKTIGSIIRPPGTYSVTIKSKNRSGLQSVGALTTEIVPSDYIPPDPAFLLVQQALNGSKQFYWSLPESVPRDLEFYRLRYNIGTSLSWENSHFLKDIPIAHESYETSLFRQGTYTILLKLVDVTGYESNEATFIQVNLSDPVPDNVVEVWDFRTPANSDTGQGSFTSRQSWEGTLTNLSIDSNGDLTVIDPLIDAIYDSSFEVTSDGHLKAVEEIEGNYALYYERITQGIIWTGANDDEIFWSAENESQQLWKQFDKFLPFPVAVAVAREEYKVRVVIKPGDTSGKIKQLKTIVDAPDIVETFNDIQIDDTGSRIVPSKPMNVLKAVNLTLQDPPGNTAVRALVLDKDPVNGALIETYDSAGIRVPGLVDAVLVGY